MEQKFRPFFLQIVQMIPSCICDNFFFRSLSLWSIQRILNVHSDNVLTVEPSWEMLQTTFRGLVSFWPAAGFESYWVLDSSQSARGQWMLGSYRPTNVAAASLLKCVWHGVDWSLQSCKELDHGMFLMLIHECVQTNSDPFNAQPTPSSQLSHSW